MAALVPSTLNQAFVKFFNSIAPVPSSDVRKLPPETYDHIVADYKDRSNSSPRTHALVAIAPFTGNSMVYTGKPQADGTTPLMNVSPFGEWRWSPMGLAGRDPIFFAQLDSELAYIETIKDVPTREN